MLDRKRIQKWRFTKMYFKMDKYALKCKIITRFEKQLRQKARYIQLDRSLEIPIKNGK